MNAGVSNLLTTYDLLTTAMVHYGKVEEVVRRRQQVLDLAYARNPERFVNKWPKVIGPPTEVWINPPARRVGA